jgi:hypothetical protein
MNDWLFNRTHANERYNILIRELIIERLRVYHVYHVLL